MKRSKLLKVMSIIVIILGALGLLSSIIMLLYLDTINNMMIDLGMPLFSATQAFVGLIGAIVAIVAGILGLVYKSKSSVLVVGSLYLIFTVGEIILSVLTSGEFSAIIFIGLIFPLLYLWGVYLSE